MLDIKASGVIFEKFDFLKCFRRFQWKTFIRPALANEWFGAVCQFVFIKRGEKS